MSYIKLVITFGSLAGNDFKSIFLVSRQKMVGMEGVSFDAVISQFIAVVFRVICCCLGVYVRLSLLEGTRIPAWQGCTGTLQNLIKTKLDLIPL